MEYINFKVTLCFEEPFWIGIYEREDDKQYKACKILFGAEPKDYEVYNFLLENFGKLNFSPAFTATQRSKKPVNPKRLQRQIKKQVHPTEIGTKAQQALKLQHEQTKLARKKTSRQQREAEKTRKFEQKQEKRKEKHKGH